MMSFLPWWATGYLFIVFGLFVAGLFTEKIRSHHEIVGSVMSFFSISVFVVCFFDTGLREMFGLLFLPMTAIGLYWEFMRAVKETSYAREMLKDEGDLSDEERSFLLNVAIGFNALVVVPGYMMGVMLCLSVLGIT